MRHVHSFVLGSLVVGLTGCASAPRVVVHERVGPCQRVAAAEASHGLLQVFSARERAPLNLTAEEFLWNNDFGRNEFLYESAYSDYSVLGQDGRVIQRVRNGSGLNAQSPAGVVLSPGLYQVEAEAEDAGGLTRTVVVPFVIEAGQTTVVHLEPRTGRRSNLAESDGHVRLADGRIVGCRAENLLSQNAQAIDSVLH